MVKNDYGMDTSREKTKGQNYSKLIQWNAGSNGNWENDSGNVCRPAGMQTERNKRCQPLKLVVIIINVQDNTWAGNWGGLPLPLALGLRSWEKIQSGDTN